MASAGTPAAFSFSRTGVMASVFRFCASPGLDARDSALIVIHARSGTACTNPSPDTVTCGSAGVVGGTCCAKAPVGARQSKKASIRYFTVIPSRGEADPDIADRRQTLTDSDAKRADQVGSMGPMPPAAPLSGLTVLDLTRVLSGPYCTMLLADMGARVIKIEQPGRGDDTRAWGPPFVGAESAYFLSVNRNKESVTLDFKTAEGRDILDRLIARSDVIVENFRPGALDRLRLDYASLEPGHSRLVYCSISGFGHDGPPREQPGYDAVIQAEGGLMSVTGDADGPPFRVGVAIADLVAGLLAALGVVMALYGRERTGRGQHVDISMFDGVLSVLS